MHAYVKNRKEIHANKNSCVIVPVLEVIKISEYHSLQNIT